MENKGARLGDQAIMGGVPVAMAVHIRAVGRVIPIESPTQFLLAQSSI